MKNKLIIFDLDGTLFTTKDVTIAAVQKAFSEMNLDIPAKDIISKHFGEMTDQLCRNLYQEGTEKEINELSKLALNYEKELIPKKGKLYPGIKDLLEILKNNNYKLIICSNGSLEYINLVLESQNIRNYFDEVFSNKRINDKGVIVKRLLDEYETDNAILIGDAYSDLLAAEKNDIAKIFAAYGYSSENYDLNYFEVKSPKNILGHVNRIELFWDIEESMKKKLGSDNFLVGINGVDTSGKTIFTNLLHKYLKSRGYQVELINLDDFHNPKETRRKGKNEIDAYINNAFNLDLLKNELLEPISNNQKIDKKFKLLDLETDTFSVKKEFSINIGSIVLVEGVLLYRNPINNYFDYRIFLDIPFDEVIKRAQKRDIPLYGESIVKKYKNKYIPLQKRYINEHNPIKKSDLVIDNSDFSFPKIKYKKGQ
ncbi:MAG: HAD hydrolase-like protein [Bacillota bacterium]